MILTTKRLRLLPWSAEHVELLAGWAATAQVVRHVGDGSPWSRERAEDRAATALEHWHRHGFGWRIATRRSDGTAVGLAALNRAGEGTLAVAADEFEIGWWLDPAAWGHGYAREAAAALRDEAFGRLGAPALVARIQAANAGSVAVAEAIGLHHAGSTRTVDGIGVELYRMSARGPSRPTRG